VIVSAVVVIMMAGVVVVSLSVSEITEGIRAL